MSKIHVHIHDGSQVKDTTKAEAFALDKTLGDASAKIQDLYKVQSTERGKAVVREIDQAITKARSLIQKTDN